MKPSPLEIRLLGPVEIKYEGKFIKINRRMERAILYVLAIEHKPISRTKLIDLLWPEANQSNPRATLRTALSRLRNDLPDEDLIHTELDQVWLDYDRCVIDLEKFEDQYQHLQHLLSAYQNNRTLPSSIADRIRKALELWRGNIILTGDNLEKYHAVDIWRQSVNNKLNHRRKFLMKRLADHYRISGQDERALAVFMELAKIDFTDIPCQCTALDILISMGRHQDAMNYCDTLENVYEHEFQSPLPEEILSRCQRSQFKINFSQSDEQNQWPIPLTMNLPLIGQQNELYQLHQAYSKGGGISIQGAMGIGKTRLVQELFQTLSPTPFLIPAVCREMEKTLPFSPLIHCLRQSIPVDMWKEIEPIWTNQLSLLLPELTTYLKDEEQQSFSRLPSGKQHLFDALLNVCQIISKKYGRILFFLDNAHWADRQTLQTISYFLSQGFFDKHGLLVIASRPEEKNPDLENLIDQSFQSKPIQIIHLLELNFFDLKDLATQVLDKPPSEAFINKLMGETGGNPFLALEIIRNIQETTYHPDKFGESSTIPLPMSIHALLRKRFLTFDEISRHILLCAAVLGDNLSPGLLEIVAGLPTFTISKAIDPLIKSGLIQTSSRDGGSQNHFQFSNEIMREVVLKEASDVHLQILHHQIAQRMASNPQYDEKAAVIANHFLLGGDPKQAFHWLLKAADYAWTLGSQEDAQRLYQQAEGLIKSESNSLSLFTNTDIINLFRQWSDFAYEAHQVELMEQLGAKLQSIGNQESHPLFLGTSQVILGNACFLRLDFETGLTLIDEGIDNLEIAGDEVTLIEAIKRKGVFSWWTMDYDQVEMSANRMLELCKSPALKDDFRTSIEFNAKHLIDSLYYARGQASSAVKMAKKLYKTYFHKLEPFDRLRSLYLLGYSTLIAAEYEKCEAFTKKGLEIARPLGNVLLEEILLIIRAKAEFIQGKLDQSYQHVTQALKSAETANRKQNIVSANCVLGDMFHVLDNNAAALQHYRVGQIREGFSSTSYYGIENKIHLAHYLASVNQQEEAQKILQRNLPIAKKYDLGEFYIQGLLTLGIWHQKESDPISASEAFLEAHKIAEERGLFYEICLVKIAHIRLLLENNDLSEVKTQLDEVLKISQKRNMTWVHLYALMMAIQLSRVNNEYNRMQQYQLSFNNIIKSIGENTKSESLRNHFDQASKKWINKFL